LRLRTVAIIVVTGAVAWAYGPRSLYARASDVEPAPVVIVQPTPVVAPIVTTRTLVKRPKTDDWQFNAYDDGCDIFATGMATQWNDHVTSSGTPADRPGLYGCALPTRRCAATAGSPFPRLPWHTLVRVWCPLTSKLVYCILIDEGPNKIAMAGTGKRGSAMIDLNPAAARALNLKRGQNVKVSIRIFRGSESAWKQR